MICFLFSYVKEAERARKKLREKWPFWKTLDYWWTYHRGNFWCCFDLV